jgi:CheY-like chemotaxis protein/anti-sigma regulatory factor (Ser/Thr protein kinase)
VAQLQNILLNLVENARRALGPEGTVVLRWRLDEREVLLEVADRGAGMDSAGLEACTRPGYSTKPESGHGHGLSGAKDLVESVGGRFEVESGLGQGTTVRLWLPLRERSGRTPGGISGFASVLLIEDDPEVADVVRLFLESDGLRCEVRGSGRAAWNALATESFDLALVDQGLPDLPGLDLAEGIRQEHPDLVVVLLTGDPSVRREPIEGGPLDAVGLKPLDRAGLRALLEEAADHARNRASQDAPRRRPAHG